jgi:5-methylcytosine-specific restriction endonuclease McrA
MPHHRNRKGRRKAMQLRASGPPLQEVVHARGNARCYFCGDTVPRKHTTMDHLTPVAQGGTAVVTNLVASCRPCNKHKGAMTLEDYREACGGIVFPGEKQA